jgi:phage tail sheath gpL-like
VRERSSTRCSETSSWQSADGELRFDATRNEQVVVGTARNTDATHVRLRLSNGAGKDTADDVVVMVTEVRRLEDSERTAMAGARPIELPLTWSGTNPAA